MEQNWSLKLSTVKFEGWLFARSKAIARRRRGRLRARCKHPKQPEQVSVGCFSLSLLVVLAVLGALRNRRRHDASLVRLARHDPLTTLGNRTQSGATWTSPSMSPTAGQSFALHLIDLDGFGFFNDTRGHPFGDKSFTAVAEKFAPIAKHRQGGPVAAMNSPSFNQKITEQREAADLARRICNILSEPFAINGAAVRSAQHWNCAEQPRRAPDRSTS